MFKSEADVLKFLMFVFPESVRLSAGPYQARGIPDVVLNVGGVAVWCEVKFGDGALSAPQARFQEKWKTAVVVWGQKNGTIIAISENAKLAGELTALLTGKLQNE